MTVSESNIKVWDLEYDECIKNMNEHNSSIVYIANTGRTDEEILTIGSSFELKTWNYVTGAIIESQDLSLDRDKKELKTLGIACCNVKAEMAYIALTTNEICVYNIIDNKVLYNFMSYQGNKYHQ